LARSDSVAEFSALPHARSRNWTDALPSTLRQVMTDKSISANTTLSIGFAVALAVASFHIGQGMEKLNSRVSSLEDWQRKQIASFERNQDARMRESEALVDTVKDIQQEISTIRKQYPLQRSPQQTPLQNAK